MGKGEAFEFFFNDFIHGGSRCFDRRFNEPSGD